MEALAVLKSIAENMQNSSFFTIMADESADVANQEQVVVCIRWIDNNIDVHEDFIGLYPVARCTAEEIVNVLLVRFLKKIIFGKNQITYFPKKSYAGKHAKQDVCYLYF